LKSQSLIQELQVTYVLTGKHALNADYDATIRALMTIDERLRVSSIHRLAVDTIMSAINQLETCEDIVCVKRISAEAIIGCKELIDDKHTVAKSLKIMDIGITEARIRQMIELLNGLANRLNCKPHSLALAALAIGLARTLVAAHASG